MRCHFPVIFLPLSFLAHAELPERTGLPALDARLPALQARFVQRDGNRQSLTQRPEATTRWDCDVPRMAVLAPLGFTEKPHDPVAWSNAGRASHSISSDITAVDIVPLSGTCSNGRLEGAVSFWYQVDLQTDSPHYTGSSRSYGLASMTLTAGKPASGIDNDTLVLTVSSNSKYVKASTDPEDGMVNVSWKNIDEGGKHVAGLESLAIARPLKLSNLPSFTVWTVRRTASPDTIETVIHTDNTKAGSPTTFTDRFDSTGTLVERHMGSMRYYLAADGSWKGEMVGSTTGLLAGGTPAAPASTATSTASAAHPATVTPIEGNSGRYLSPFTSDGVAAAWVDKAINASLGSSLGGMAGAYAGQKALEQVPFIGGFLGQKAGAAAGRGIALKSVGGETYLRETSDLSFNNIHDMAKWLVQTHAGHARFAEIMKAAGQIYPELTQAYLLALRQR